MANVILPNNNTSLYNSTGNATPVDGNINANNINASGNVTVGGFIVANGSITTDSNFVGNLIGNVTGNVTGNITGNIILGGGNTEVIFNNGGVTGSSPDFTFDDATNELSVTGNVTANYYFGDGSQLTGLPATYGNANVAAYLPTYTGNLAGGNLSITGAISATGNITGNYVLGNGSLLTGLPATYSNANVQAYLPTYSGNLNPNFVSATGNVTALNLKTSGATGNIVGANYVSANFYLGDGGLLSNVTSNYGNTEVNAHLAAFGANSISTTGNIAAGIVSATGNITGNYIIGNGSQLTGLPAGYSNADVNAHLAAFGSNVISTTGNITAGYLIGDGSQITNLPGGSYGNANVANYLPTYSGVITASDVSATGNVTGNVIIGNGSQLSNITGANVVGTVANATFATLAGNASYATAAGTANTVTGNAQANITSVGTLTSLNSSGNISTSGNVIGAFLWGDGSNITGVVSGSKSTQFEVKNNSGGSLTKGTPVYATGSVGASTRLLVSASSANVSGTMPCIGLLTTNLADQAEGYAISVGTLTTIDTSAYSSGQLLYVAAGGGITGSKPTGTSLIQPIGAVGRVDASTGTIETNIWNYYQLPNLGNGNIWQGNSSGVAVEVTAYGNANVAAYLPTYNGNIGNINGAPLELNADQVHIHASNLTSNVNGISLNTPSGGSFVAMETPQVYIAEPPGGGGTRLQVAGNIITQPGNILVTGYVSATGNITGNYFIGNGSQLTGITTAAGGTDGQIQFNSGTAFAGNTNMSFNSATGDIVLGNLVINGLEILPGNIGNALESTSIAANVTDYQLRIGNSYNGNTNWAMTAFSGSGNSVLGVGARLLQSDTYNISNSSGRLQGMVSQNYVNIQGNITNGVTRFQGAGSFLAIGGGSSANTMNQTNSVFPVQAFGSAVAVGNVNANLNIGNTTISFVNGQLFTGQVGNGSTVNTMTVMGGTIINSGATANIANVVGYHVNWGGNAGGAVTNYAVFYHAGNTTSNTIMSPVTTGNLARAATNYFAFRNDDDLAKSRLGSLEKFHYFTSNVAIASGNITINKNNGQVQNLYMTENVTGVTFSNFVTRTQKPDATQVNQTDVVTLVVQQGATPYDLTLPTGNANIRYAGGLSTVGNTANSTTLIQITGVYNYNDSATQYLINIGDEYT